MIKYKGFGIAPAEIEALLFEHPGVADVAVIGKPISRPARCEGLRGPEEPALTADRLLDWARGRLAGYKTLHGSSSSTASEDRVRQDPPARPPRARAEAAYFIRARRASLRDRFFFFPLSLCPES